MKRLTARRWLLTVGVMSALLVVAVVVCSLIGPTPLNLEKAFDSSLAPNPQAQILFGIRLPRILLAGLIGGALAGAGVVFQALLRNPLADPYVLGISSGAALGAATGVLLSAHRTMFGFSAMTVCAFVGALITIFFVYTVAQSYGRVITHSLLLTGVIINYVFAALIMLITSIVDFTKARDIIFWMMGSLGKIECEAMGDVRGDGLFIGLDWVSDREAKTPDPQGAKRVINRLKDKGFLASTAGALFNVVKLRPPLVFNREHADLFLTAFEETVGELR